MALVVSTRLLQDGSRNATMQFVGTGGAGDPETSVAKVIVANLNPVPLVVKIWDIEYDCNGIIVQLLWDATTPVVFANLQGFGKIPYRHIGGAPNPKAAGFTGNILFSTSPQAAAWNYTIKLGLRKTGVVFTGGGGP
jgi:hypothetical protein